jgi:uncharacterized membrane protein YccF (DUF307 family)
VAEPRIESDWLQAKKTPLTITTQGTKYGLFVRALYFIFIGWWFGLLWALLSWVMYATVIGAPLGAVMMNQVPGAISLKAKEQHIAVVPEPGGYAAGRIRVRQRPLWARILYYPIGLVLSLLLILLAWLLCVLVITIPLGILLFNKVPVVASLHRG